MRSKRLLTLNCVFRLLNVTCACLESSLVSQQGRDLPCDKKVKTPNPVAIHHNECIWHSFGYRVCDDEDDDEQHSIPIVLATW